VKPEDVGLYSVQVSNIAGAVLSSNALLQVDQSPVVLCKDVVVSASTGCLGAASIDNGSFDPDGDPIVIVQTPPGPYPLGTNIVSLIATDPWGASNTCSAVVVVRDTTPPTLVCPGDILLEFASEAGAPAIFTPQASDDCSPPVALECATASGSTFPIGDTLVGCVATDAAGNKTHETFRVTVLGAQGVKSNVLSELTTLAAGETRPAVSLHLTNAIQHLTDSLAPDLWMDQARLNRQHGDQDFNDEKAAVQPLNLLLKDPQHAVSPNMVEALIGRIVRCDRLLACVALNDAQAAGVDPKQLEQGWSCLARGDGKVADGEYEAGIDSYRQAWHHALLLNARLAVRSTAGVLALEFPGFPQAAYAIETSTNCINWVQIGTVTAGPDGAARFPAPSKTEEPAQFFRARPLP
jgi:hypothetical protein